MTTFRRLWREKPETGMVPGKSGLRKQKEGNTDPAEDVTAGGFFIFTFRPNLKTPSLKPK